VMTAVLPDKFPRIPVIDSPSLFATQTSPLAKRMVCE
jgi:hypothetical protein